jgi:predicted metal-dependent peptidase
MFEDINPEDKYQIEEIIRSGIIAARKVMPYCSSAISAMQLRITDQVPTFAIDSYFRLYVSPHFVKKIVEEAKSVSSKKKCATCGASEHHPIAYVAGVLCHEAWHPLRKHMKLNKNLDIPQDKFLLWNIAADLEINDDLVQAFKHCDTPKICLPEGVWLPNKVQDTKGKVFPDNKMAAEYYFMLLEIQEKVKEMIKNGQFEGDMDPNGGEEPSESNPGISDIERTLIGQEVAEKIKKECSKQRGTVPGGFVIWAEEQLAAPQYNWRTELSRIVRHTINKVQGDLYRSFKRLNRRCASIDFKTVLPSTYSTKPNVTVIQDTSGSMGGDLLTDSMAEVQGILKVIQASVTLIDCDAAVHSKKKITSVRGTQLKGGGGTDLTVGFEAALSGGQKPDVIIVFTDGYTPWPKDEPVGTRCIAVIVGQELGSNLGIPSWMKSVFIPPNKK